MVKRQNGEPRILDRRRMLGLLAGLGAAGATGGLAACGASPGDTPKTPIRVGLLVPQTGANKTIGSDLRDGFELYLGERDDKLGGYPVKLIVEDEGETVAEGQQALQRLYDSQVLAIAGVANSELLTEIRNTVEEKQVPLLATHGSSPDMPSAIYIWRTSFVNDQPGEAVGTYLRARVQPEHRVGAIAMSTPFGDDVLFGFQARCSVFGTPVRVPANADPGSMSGYANQLRASGELGAIFCYLPPSHLIEFLKALGDAGYAGPVYAPGTVSEDAGALAALKELPAGGAVDLFTAMHYSADLSNSANYDFSALFQTRHKRSPTAYAVAAYDAASVLDRAVALAAADGLSSQRVNQVIANVGQVISPRGNWEFTQNRVPQQKWYLRKIQKDGPVLSNVLVSDLVTLG